MTDDARSPESPTADGASNVTSNVSAADPGVARFLAAATALGVGNLEVRVMDESTHTAAEAAAAVGAPVEAIVKSLVLMAADAPLLALVSGPNRVDTELLSETLGVPVRMAKAREAKDATGYSIGGVPPFGHPPCCRPCSMCHWNG